MIRAVCFNKNVFRWDMLNKVILRIGGIWSGNLVREGPVNCIESFSDGRVYYSYCNRQEVGKGTVTDCGEDLEKFIYVNSYSYGKKETAAR